MEADSLDGFLTKHNASIHVDLVYWVTKPVGSIFEVHFWKPNENFDHNRLYIRAGALPKDKAFEVKTNLETEILPRFRQWLDRHEQLPDHSPLLNKVPYFNARYTGKDIVIEERYI